MWEEKDPLPPPTPPPRVGQSAPSWDQGREDARANGDILGQSVAAEAEEKGSK